MEKHHAVVLEELGGLLKNSCRSRADMLEHADRDDAVESFRHLAIVLQAEPESGPALPTRALGRSACCSSESVIAGDVGAGRFRRDRARARPSRSQCRGLAVPARAGALRRDGASWRFGRRRGSHRALEIGAGVLHVRVEEERVELPVEIVVMGDVAARGAAVELTQPAAEVADQPFYLGPNGGLPSPRLREHASTSTSAIVPPSTTMRPSI